MELTRGKKLFLGFLTIWPWIYIPSFVIFIFSMMFLGENIEQNFEGFPFFMLIIFPLHFLTMIDIFLLMGFYIYRVVKDKTLSDDHRLVWILAIFMGNMIVMPVYWYLKIWKESEAEITA